MEFRTLIPSYLDGKEINTLRRALCEIIFTDYKGVTFFLNQQLEDKKNVLIKIHQFLKEYPEIYNYKGNSAYWYPYKTVNGSRNLDLYNEFYPDIDNEITYFDTKDAKENRSDYLFDPVKLQFFLMCRDIQKMDCNSETAQKIIQINNETFQILFDVVGDTISYNGLNTLEHIKKYIQDNLDGEKKVKNDPETSQDYKDLLVRSYRSFNDFSYLINDVISIYNESKLQNELPEKPDNKTIKTKI